MSDAGMLTLIFNLEQQGILTAQSIETALKDARILLTKFIGGHPDVADEIYRHCSRTAATSVRSVHEAGKLAHHSLASNDPAPVARALATMTEATKVLGLPWALSCYRLRRPGTKADELQGVANSFRSHPDQVLGQLTARYRGLYRKDRMALALLIRRSEAHGHTDISQHQTRVGFRDDKMSQPKWYKFEAFRSLSAELFVLLSLIGYVYLGGWLRPATGAFGKIFAEALTADERKQVLDPYVELHNSVFPGEEIALIE